MNDIRKFEEDLIQVALQEKHDRQIKSSIARCSVLAGSVLFLNFLVSVFLLAPILVLLAKSFGYEVETQNWMVMDVVVTGMFLVAITLFVVLCLTNRRLMKLRGIRASLFDVKVIE